ncbi:hypothetical protein WN944_000050 [Citrus x changshan-huyou]|uniref:Pentatricopeptide repeat-containing protein n=1 Tax=Citrus x changshan-huyou TaxID=2935761 RepID=A0AAP0MC48_9ROSI
MALYVLRSSIQHQSHLRLSQAQLYTQRLFSIINRRRSFRSQKFLLESSIRRGHRLTCSDDDNLPCTLNDIMSYVGNQCCSKTRHWLSNKDSDNEGNPQAVFNALDLILKENLDRLKTMRDTGPVRCTLETDYRRHVAVIRDLCLGGKIGTALWLRRKMIQKGTVPDVLTHNYLVNGLCKIGDLEKADHVIREMSEMRPSPNCATYNAFITGYCRVNELDKALHLFSTMANNGIRPNRVTHNILVHALCKKGLLGDAVKFLGEVLADDDGKATSDVITSTILMDSYFKNGDKFQALALWNDMFQKNIQTDIVAYNVVINGFCLNGDISSAFAYFCQMLKRGSLPDVITYNTLLNCLCKQGKLDEASHFYGVMSKTGVAPDQISYKTIIQGLCIHGDIVKAREFLLSMLEKLVVPEPHIWNVIIDGYGRCGDLSNAFSIRDLMLSFGVSSNVFTFNALILAETRGGSIFDAFSLKKEMLLDGIFPDVFTYNLLIGASCNLGHIHLALQLYDEMLRRGITPDIITYTELIKGHCARGNMKEAEEVFAKIQTLGLAIDHIPFRILKKRYRRMKESDKIVGLANALQQLEISLIASPNSDVDDNYTCELALGASHFVLQDDMKAFISTTDLIIVKVALPESILLGIGSNCEEVPMLLRSRRAIGGKLEQHMQSSAQIPKTAERTFLYRSCSKKDILVLRARGAVMKNYV